MSKHENTLIYFGFRLGILGMIMSFLLTVGAAVGLYKLSLTVICTIIGLAISGAISTFFSNRRWGSKYHDGQLVPCLFCSKELSNKDSALSPAGSYRYAEVQCPHCKKMMSY